MNQPSRAWLIAAFATVYLVWGSTYLAIRIAIETLPPFGMAGLRFLLAGLLSYGLARMLGAPPPTRMHWRNSAVVGALLMFGGNGLVTLAEGRVTSSVAAVLVATMPLWMTAIDARWFSRRRPRPLERIGLLAGLVGVALLIVPSVSAIARVDVFGALTVVVAAALWATGSLLSRRLILPGSLMMSAALQMLTGGLILVVASGLTGEPMLASLANCSWRSAVAVGYLVLAGSILALSAYLWLLRVASPAAVGTYAFVNPIVAVALGWWFLAEPVTLRMLFATAFIVGAVATILAARRRPRKDPVAVDLTPARLRAPAA